MVRLVRSATVITCCASSTISALLVCSEQAWLALHSARDAEKWMQARGLKPASAAEILDRADERRIWYRLLNSEDENVVLRAVVYLTDRRDGRPAPQINVTQVGINISAEDIARTRAVVREIQGQLPPEEQPQRLALAVPEDSSSRLR
jgi:hypothetical protein